MGHMMGHRYSRGFALPVVMISSVVMMMLLLSGLTAASSVNVGLRIQYEDRMVQSATAAGLAMAKNCIDRNDNTITWTNDTPLKPNTNCFGVDQLDCPAASTNDKCWLVNTSIYRSKFSVGVATSASGGATVSSKGTVQQFRKSTNTVVKNISNDRKAATGSDTVFRGGANSRLSGVVSGGSHTCGVDVSGKAYCWGYNAYGQLGNGTKTNSSIPVPVSQGVIPAGVSILSLASASDSTCAIASNGNVYCWGYNMNGQLGNGGTAESLVPALTSVGAIPNGVTLIDIAAGSSSFCGLGTNGKIYCWGSNNNGMLGNGDTTQRTSPTAVATTGAITSSTVISKIAMGTSNTCAIDTTGKAYCWGYGSYGMLGNGGTSASSLPVQVSQGAVPAAVKLRDIGIGSWMGCAIGTDNKAYCWGRNHFGQLGNGNNTDYSSPVATLQGAIPTTAIIQNISVGGSHVCVSASNIRIYCWGNNASGQLANGVTGGSSNVPVAGTGSGSGSIQSATAGLDHTCGVRVDGRPWCWGSNSFGQLGNNTTTTSNLAVPVTIHFTGSSEMSLGIKKIEVGGTTTDTSCATTGDDAMYCWGANNFGQYGNASTSNSIYPLTALGYVLTSSQMAVSTMSIGGDTACVSLRDTRTWCMGFNDVGQIGNNSTATATTPYLVDTSAGAMPDNVKPIAIDTGSKTTCAIGSDGKAYCWGAGTVGQLGNGATSNSSLPVVVSQGAIPAGVALRQITVRSSTVCALSANSWVYCWGNGSAGQLGNNSVSNSSLPVAVSQGAIPSGVKIIKVEGSCVLASNGWVYCWGTNALGKLANGGTPTQSTTPVAIQRGAIPSDATIKDISIGDNDTVCALASDSWVYCWGYNNNGQVGNGTVDANSGKFSPVAVSQGAIPNGVTLTGVSAGATSACATASNLRAYCWGNNSVGQLGNNSTATSTIPVAVNQKLLFRGSGSRLGSSVANTGLLFLY